MTITIVISITITIKNYNTNGQLLNIEIESVFFLNKKNESNLRIKILYQSKLKLHSHS